MNKQYMPPGASRAEVPQCRICKWCSSVRELSDFIDEHGPCVSCREKQAADARSKDLVEGAKETANLFGSGAASLDRILEMLLSEMGGAGAFVTMLAEQFRVAFDQNPGRASNLQMGIKLFQLLGQRDANQIDRDLASLSYEELKTERVQIYSEFVMQHFGDAEKRAFAQQLLHSIGAQDPAIELIEGSVRNEHPGGHDAVSGGEDSSGAHAQAGSGDRPEGTGGSADLPSPDGAPK